MEKPGRDHLSQVTKVNIISDVTNQIMCFLRGGKEKTTDQHISPPAALRARPLSQLGEDQPRQPVRLQQSWPNHNRRAQAAHTKEEEHLEHPALVTREMVPPGPTEHLLC